MKDQDTVQKFIELRSKGVSFARIADQLGVAKSTLILWSREHQHLIPVDTQPDELSSPRAGALPLFPVVHAHRWTEKALQRFKERIPQPPRY